MPYKSDKQRRFMHAKHPEIAAKWDAEIRAKKQVKKAFENHPKYRMQNITLSEKRKDGGLYIHDPDTVHQRYKGKSLILRRPKYQVVGMTSKKPNKGSSYIAHVSPNYRVGHEDSVRLQQAYKTKAKKVTSAKGGTFKNVVEKRVNEKRLAHQKKLSAATSIAGGTLGLSGLTALALKNKDLATKLNVVAGGLGGVGAYNYASIQNQEAKKKAPRQNVYVVRNKKQIKNIKSGLEPVTKGLQAMDFGLSDVRQGENVHIISKRQQTTYQQRKRGDQGANVGQLAGPAVGYFGAAAHRGGKMGYGLSRSLGDKPVASLATGARVAPSAMKAAAKPSQMLGTALKHPFLTAGTMVGGGLAGQKIGQMSAKPKQPKVAKPVVGPKKPKRQLFGKSKDWMNISEHQRRSRDSRRTSQRGETVAGLGGAAISGAAGHYIGSKSSYATSRGRNFYPNIDDQIQGLRKGGKDASTRYKLARTIGTGRENSARYAAKPLIAAAKTNPHAAIGAAGAALMAGGMAVRTAGRANEKRHDRAVAQLRRKRVTKAYNPEAKRQRRLENTSTGLAVSSGAAGAGAGGYALKARTELKSAKTSWQKGLRAEADRVGAVNETRDKAVTGRGANANAQNLKNWKRAALHPGGGRHMIEAKMSGAKGLKSAGKAGALGLTAVGLAVGSDRVRSYRSGRGGTYRQLHRGS